MLSAAYPTAGLSQHISRSNRESGRSNYQDVLQRSRRTLRSSCSSRPSRVADDLLSRPSTRAGYEVSTTRKHRKSTRSRLSATGKDINPKCSPLEHYRLTLYLTVHDQPLSDHVHVQTSEVHTEGTRGHETYKEQNAGCQRVAEVDSESSP